jgi:hypothetical protein
MLVAVQYDGVILLITGYHALCILSFTFSPFLALWNKLKLHFIDRVVVKDFSSTATCLAIVVCEEDVEPA